MQHQAFARAALLSAGCGAVSACAVLARSSAAGRPTWGALAAWALLSAASLAGWASARALARSGALPAWHVRFVLGVAAAGGLLLLCGRPALSDDIWRYLHDGRVLAAGRNPYAHAPADPALDDVAGPERSRVNHPTVRTVYPPIAEATFAAVVAAGGGERAWRALAGLAALALLLVLARALAKDGAERLALAAWNPVALVETFGSGHLDVLAVLPLVAALVVLRRRNLASALLLAGAGVKLLPGAVALVLAPRLGAWRAALVGALTLLLAWPAAFSRGTSQPGLSAYAERWEFNGVLYPVVRRAVEAADLKGALDSACVRLGLGWPAWTGPQWTSRSLLALAFAAALALAARRLATGAAGEWEAGLLATGAWALLSPTLHPWYLVWVLPFAVVRGSPAFVWLAFAAGATYVDAVAAAGGPWRELAWPRLLEMGPFAALFALEARRRRRR